jgi:hypothetical protein
MSIHRISAARLELALDRLKSSDWERFERLCSVFLASEFPGLRTMASPGGDRGRDAELFTAEGNTNTLFQFAVRGDWDRKISETLGKLTIEFPTVTAVIFLSSQQIGAKGDQVRARFKQQGVSLDIRDRSWFVERVDTDDSRNNAAGELARVVVDPYLIDTGISFSARALEGSEARTALIFLELQAKDDDTSKGFTKACYESLVKAALQGTNVEHRRSRVAIQNFVSGLLPQHVQTQLKPFVDAALRRLERSTIKHYHAEDEFHLAFEESERTKDKVAELAILNASLMSDARDIIELTVSNDEDLISRSATLVRSIMDSYFYKLGEEFAQSVVGGRDIPLHDDLLRSVTLEMSPPGLIAPSKSWADFLRSTVASLINSPSQRTLELFRVLSTAYTLFAFLSEVPDVQKATKKLFQHGTLWFDTSILLPLFAEQAFPEDMRPFTDLMAQLRRVGLQLRATPGVIKEIERHLNLCSTYLRVPNWVGRVPYVYQRFVLAGGKAPQFNGWREQFHGNFRPTDDLTQWLKESAGVEASEPPSFDPLPDELVREVRHYWQTVQDQRRSNTDGGSIHALRLAEHDTENYLSVLVERAADLGKSPLGYTSWLVTMDSAAWRLLPNISSDSASFVRHSPIISLDFLLKYLSFGPRRDRVETVRMAHNRIFISTIYENIPADLINAADQVRESCKGLSERMIQRRVRDELDRRKLRAGAVQQAGLDELDSALQSMF